MRTKVCSCMADSSNENEQQCQKQESPLTSELKHGSLTGTTKLGNPQDLWSTKHYSKRLILYDSTILRTCLDYPFLVVYNTSRAYPLPAVPSNVTLQNTVQSFQSTQNTHTHTKTPNKRNVFAFSLWSFTANNDALNLSFHPRCLVDGSGHQRQCFLPCATQLLPVDEGGVDFIMEAKLV